MFVKTFKYLSQIFFLNLVLVLTPLATVSAEESIAEMVINDCKVELVDYCSKVTIGRGRVIACLYAHSDKLSEQCSLAIEVGVVHLNMILSAVSHVVDKCQVDLEKNCGDVEIGSGRMYQCMSNVRDSLEPICKAAFLQAEDDLK